MKFNELPVSLGQVFLECKEMMFYQYLPIKLQGQTTIHVEDRVKDNFGSLISKVLCDYVGVYGLDSFVDSYVYVTVKHLWQTRGTSFNRQGWHTDGFGTQDINYIWSNRNPTVFNISDFNLSTDDTVSILQMEEQAAGINDYIFANNTLFRLTPFNVHRVNPIQQEGMRTFCKVSFSKDKYNLKGNSHNHLLGYNWEMRDRDNARNIPQGT
jgi:hypothetical protein